MAKSMPTAESFFYPEVSFPEFQAELGMLAYDCHLTWKVHLGVRGDQQGSLGAASPRTWLWSGHQHGASTGAGVRGGTAYSTSSICVLQKSRGKMMCPHGNGILHITQAVLGVRQTGLSSVVCI